LYPSFAGKFLDDGWISLGLEIFFKKIIISFMLFSLYSIYVCVMSRNENRDGTGEGKD